MSEPSQRAVERRTARSDDTLIALARMLEAVRRNAKLEAIAVGDDAGLLLGFAGEPDLCAELAAVAPLRASAANDTALGRGQIAADGRYVERLRVADADLFISGFGAQPDLSLRAVIAGCQRILAEKPQLAR